VTAMSMPQPRPKPQIYLHPGQIVVTSEPGVVTTILGSCVAVCLWDEKTRVAGINHYLLPKNPMPGTGDARYGDTAIEALVGAMWKHGAALDRLVAKVFGGAGVLPFTGNHGAIGTQNADLARLFLQRRSIEIAIDRTGGSRGRKLLFDTGDGSAWVKEL
jgi:chemotaxis protein CheD